jgi:hypothetical protein
MLVQLLRLGGIAAFLFSGVVIVAGLAVMLFATLTGRPRLLTFTATAIVVWFTSYALALMGGPSLTPRRTLAAGDEMAFCGLDCHLHLSVADVRRDSGLAVRLHFRSDAKEAAEYPSHLWIRAVDAAGHEYAPVRAAPLAPLVAGAEYDRELRFDLPAGVTADRLLVTWGDWQDYLVPGPENAMVQRRRSFLIGRRAA